MKRVILMIILLAMPLNIGCGVPINPIGPAVSLYVAWKEGEAHKYYPYDAITCYKAMKRSLTTLGYEITEDDEQSYSLVADANNRFKITIEQREQNQSKVSIRVNFWGDKPHAELIYEELDRQVVIVDYEQKQKRSYFNRFLDLFR